MSAGSTSAWWVTSRPAILIGIPDSKTIAAASGSAHMLNSAAAVVLPSPSDPPISQMAAMRSRRPGAARSNSATLVSGPVATRVSGSSASRRSALASSSALIGAGPTAGSGRSAPSSPEGPWTSTGTHGSRTIGRAAPAATGTSVRPRRVRTRSALRVVRSSGALPATVVIASGRSSGRASARAIARASS